MEKDIEKAVRQLARNNFDAEEGLELVVWLWQNAKNEIRIIEVNKNGLPFGDVMPFYFAPSKLIPFPVLLADITPDEWEKVKRDEISLPEGWSLKDCKIFHRSEFEVVNVA